MLKTARMGEDRYGHVYEVRGKRKDVRGKGKGRYADLSLLT
jgi:hypothetical protein